MSWSGEITGSSPLLVFTINLGGLIGLLRIVGHTWLLEPQTVTQSSVAVKYKNHKPNCYTADSHSYFILQKFYHV